jgi:ATP-dependent DNA helicase RecG
LSAGQLELVVGTHALLSEDVGFRRLGLVIVDEQHRFGVEQRNRLREKGLAPHLLAMTATPIPRSLALTAFGELDVSTLEERPPGRLPVRTRLVLGRRGLTEARATIARWVREGRRGFVVVPLVEESEAVEASHVEETAAALLAAAPALRVRTVHGRMAGSEKDAALRDLEAGALDVVVATTVIEVGVDVPSATFIVIEHAERFGLAALHQLRGRVGRGGGAAECVLHAAASPGDEVADRLAILVETEDGFRIAERDLALRGPGEVFGTKQSGAPAVRLFGLGAEGLSVLVDARGEARALVEADPTLGRWPALRAAVERRQRSTGVFSGEAG